VIGKTKTRRERILHLSQSLAEILSSIKRTRSPFVFPRWRSPDAVSRKFHRYVQAAGISPCRLHDLRHTAASYLAMADVPTETIAKLLGHTDARTTRIYAHLSPAYQAGVMDKLGETMAGGMGPNITSIKGGKK
jgi:integrase